MRAFILSMMLVLAICGCNSTVVPKTVKSSVASWDGTNQNSGLITFLPGNRLLITQNAMDRYLALCTKYQLKFNPPINLKKGIEQTNDLWIITPDHVVRFDTMNRWQKSGL